MTQRFGDLVLHDQKGDAVDTRYSVQTPEGGVLFLFNECGLTAREVFETFVFGCNFTLSVAAAEEGSPESVVAQIRADPKAATRAFEAWDWATAKQNPDGTLTLDAREATRVLYVLGNAAEHIRTILALADRAQTSGHHSGEKS